MAQLRSALSVLTVLVILGGISWGVYYRIQSAPDEDADGADGTEVPEVDPAAVEVQSVVQSFNTNLPTPVEGATVVRDTLRIYVIAKARAEPLREARISAQVSGVVQRVRVRENQRARGGQLLIQIDTTEYALSLAESRAALGRAQIDYEVRLLQDDVLDDPELRASRAERARFVTGLAQAEVNLQRAEIDMRKTRVTAPFAGRIADLKVVEGQYVSAGTELLTVVTLDPIKVVVSVLETAVVDLVEGRGATMVFSALPDTTFTGRVETINPKVDLDTKTARVTVLLPNPDGRIVPGMYADARVEARQFPDVIQVPRTAIRETTDRRTHLFVAENGRAKWIYVPLGRMSHEMVELLGQPGSPEWVEPGWTVLIRGHQSIIHDGIIELVEDVARAGGRPTR